MHRNNAHNTVAPHWTTSRSYRGETTPVIWKATPPSRRTTIKRWIELVVMCVVLLAVSWFSVEYTKADTTSVLNTFMENHEYTQQTRDALKRSVHQWSVSNPGQLLEDVTLMDYMEIFHRQL